MIKIWKFTNGAGMSGPDRIDDPNSAFEGADSFDRATAGALHWIDLESPSPEDLSWIRKTFRIHPIAIEDHASPGERARIDAYAGYYSIVFITLDLEKDGVEDADRIVERPLTIYAGERFLITLHDYPSSRIDEAAGQWARSEEDLEPEIGMALYSLLDVIVDDYYPLVDRVAELVETLEDAVLDETASSNPARILDIKRQVLYVRRAATPGRDVLNTLLRRELPIIHERNIIYFQDVYDHLIRVVDTLDTHREILAGTLDLHVSVASNRLANSANRLNETMQMLTSWSIILMSASLIAGIYGMNFDGMPELHWRFGYPLALGIMLAIGITLTVLFRRRKWL